MSRIIEEPDSISTAKLFTELQNSQLHGILIAVRELVHIKTQPLQCRRNVLRVANRISQLGQVLVIAISDYQCNLAFRFLSVHKARREDQDQYEQIGAFGGKLALHI